jgi:hypothetical protein
MFWLLFFLSLSLVRSISISVFFSLLCGTHLSLLYLLFFYCSLLCAFVEQKKAASRPSRGPTFQTTPLKVSKLALPTLVRCILLMRERYLDLEGIFRVSGSSDVVRVWVLFLFVSS